MKVIFFFNLMFICIIGNAQIKVPDNFKLDTENLKYEKSIVQFFGYNLGVSHLLVENELGRKYKQSRWSTKEVMIFENVDALGYKSKVTFFFGKNDKLTSGIISFRNNSFELKMVGETKEFDFSYEGIQKYEKIKKIIEEKYGTGIESPGVKKLEEVINLDLKTLLKNGAVTYFYKWTLLNGHILLSVDKDGETSLLYKTNVQKDESENIDKSII